MHKAIKILIGIVALLLALVVGVCIAFTVMYETAEVTVPEITAPTLNGENMALQEANWTQSVCLDLREKSASQAAAAAPLTIEAKNADPFTVTVPEGYAVNYTVTNKDTGVQGAQGDESSFRLTDAGVYDMTLTLTKPKNETDPYGSYTYAAEITITAEPEIAFSALEAAQGDVVTIIARNVAEQPTISSSLTTEPFVEFEGGWRTFIGFTYNHATGTYPVTVTSGDLTQTANITVVDGTFTEQHMQMSSETTEASYGVPGAAQQWRDKIWPLYETHDDETYWEGPFIWPVDGREINTEYGLFRYVNGVYSERHPGLDIDADTGDNVYAPNSGRVVLAEFLYYTGNTIVIEHGGGLKSFLYHMDSINVSEGDMVTQGQVIGHVGSTGYSTGAHMHYEVRIANQSVSPMDILEGKSGIYFGDNS